MCRCLLCRCRLFFFFKQKTAYEMRISDWSSECALPICVASAVRWSQRHRRTGGVAPGKLGGHRKPVLLPERDWLLARVAAEPDLKIGRASCRERGCQYV